MTTAEIVTAPPAGRWRSAARHCHSVVVSRIHEACFSSRYTLIHEQLPCSCALMFRRRHQWNGSKLPWAINNHPSFKETAMIPDTSIGQSCTIVRIPPYFIRSNYAVGLKNRTRRAWDHGRLVDASCYPGPPVIVQA